MGNENLEERINEFITGAISKENLYELILECINIDSIDGIIKLAESEYGGFTYDFELKYPAAVAAVYWGNLGIEKLCNAAVGSQKPKDIKIVAEILSCAINSKLNDLRFIDKNSTVFKKINLSDSKYQTEEFKSKAKELLIYLMVNTEKYISFPQNVLKSVI